MKDKAVEYFQQGYNCSQCILKAVEYKYKIPITKQCYTSLNGVNMGFGIGIVCSVIIAGTMAFGLMFDTNTTKKLRLMLINEVQDKFGTLNCIELRKKSKNTDCVSIISEIAGFIDKIIADELH